METINKTQDYKTKQLVARSIEEIAYTERSKISSYIFTSKEYELGRIIKEVKQLGIFASKVAETIEKSMKNNYRYYLASVSKKQAWIIACAVVENNIDYSEL